jgi:protein arginine kinase activator
MKSECDKCGKPATVHLTEIADGQKLEKHLCEDCAAAEGITVKANLPISQLLEDFILQTAAPGGQKAAEVKCDVCGLTFGEFRQKALLGCPHDYEAFGPLLEALIARAQEGASQHVGKVPSGAGADRKRQNNLLRLRAQLRNAVGTEDYKLAARLRDRIKLEEQS